MTLSLKTIASNCLSVSPPFSVVRDVFGYSAPRLTMSLKRQLELVKGESLGINLILVGVENFTPTDYEEIESAVQFMRDIYDDVDVGIRRVGWYQISAADAGSYTTINSSGEAHDLTDDWYGPSGYLDVFVVRSMTGADGWSAINGPCSKDDKEMTGSVVSLNGSFNNSGNTFAHEIGHYLKLDHVAAANNFIGNNGDSNSNTLITAGQGTKMKSHCYVTKVC